MFNFKCQRHNSPNSSKHNNIEQKKKIANQNSTSVFNRELTTSSNNLTYANPNQLFRGPNPDTKKKKKKGARDQIDRPIICSIYQISSTIHLGQTSTSPTKH